MTDTQFKTVNQPYPLAAYDGARPPAPEWFRKAIETPYTSRSVDVDGTKIFYQQWGKPEKPGLLFIHGDGAHGHWYDFIAPSFADDYNVVAITLAGMGDSGWHQTYSLDTYLAEQFAVMTDAGMFDHAKKPTIAAHSLGGIISLPIARQYGHLIEGIVLLDSSIHTPDEPLPHSKPDPLEKQIFYPDKLSALARFRLLPPRQCPHHFILDHIARHSIKETDQNGISGWTWKFDPSLWATLDWEQQDIWEILATQSCKVGFIKGEESVLFTQKVADDILGYVEVPMLTVDGAGHHIFVDKPLETIAALKNMFSLWNE